MHPRILSVSFFGTGKKSAFFPVPKKGTDKVWEGIDLTTINPLLMYFRFLFDEIQYECTAMPFGLAPAPRIATTFLLPAIRCLCRRQL